MYYDVYTFTPRHMRLPRLSFSVSLLSRLLCIIYIIRDAEKKNIITICRTQCKHKHRLDFSKNVLVYSILLTVTCSHTHAAGLARTPLPPLGRPVVSLRPPPPSPVCRLFKSLRANKSHGPQTSRQSLLLFLSHYTLMTILYYILSVNIFKSTVTHVFTTQPVTRYILCIRCMVGRPSSRCPGGGGRGD